MSKLQVVVVNTMTFMSETSYVAAGCGWLGIPPPAWNDDTDRLTLVNHVQRGESSLLYTDERLLFHQKARDYWSDAITSCSIDARALWSKINKLCNPPSARQLQHCVRPGVTLRREGGEDTRYTWYTQAPHEITHQTLFTRSSTNLAH